MRAIATSYKFILGLLLSLILVEAMAVEPVKGLTLLSGDHPAPKLELTDIDGNQHRLSDYRGRVVIVNFWATWCPPCRREMPSMQRAWEQLRSDGIVMLAVDIGEDEDTIFAFTANYDIDFPLLMDLESSTTNDWPVLGLPSTFIVDTKGALVYRAVGGREWDSPELLKAIRALVK